MRNEPRTTSHAWRPPSCRRSKGDPSVIDRGKFAVVGDGGGWLTMVGAELRLPAVGDEADFWEDAGADVGDSTMVFILCVAVWLRV
jgi:hypothetical protein